MGHGLCRLVVAFVVMMRERTMGPGPLRRRRRIDLPFFGPTAQRSIGVATMCALYFLVDS
jgi:hypothetical protein